MVHLHPSFPRTSLPAREAPTPPVPQPAAPAVMRLTSLPAELLEEVSRMLPLEDRAAFVFSCDDIASRLNAQPRAEALQAHAVARARWHLADLMAAENYGQRVDRAVEALRFLGWTFTYLDEGPHRRLGRALLNKVVLDVHLSDMLGRQNGPQWIEHRLILIKAVQTFAASLPPERNPALIRQMRGLGCESILYLASAVALDRRGPLVEIGCDILVSGPDMPGAFDTLRALIDLLDLVPGDDRAAIVARLGDAADRFAPAQARALRASLTAVQPEGAVPRWPASMAARRNAR